MIKLSRRYLAAAAIAAALLLTPGKLSAQANQPPGGGPGGPGGGFGGRGFDPEAMRQRMMDNLKERFEVTNDDEWKVLQAAIEKVMRLRASTGGMGGPGMFGRGRGGPGGQGGGDNANAPRRPRNPMFGEPLPEIDELQKAVDAKASKDELKAKMAKLRDARKGKEAELAKAQEDLRKLLSVRQEATAVLMGLLN